MSNHYYDTITGLEKQGISPDYIRGWASGFLGNPKLEEQRITDSYDAGYGDGVNRDTENAANWKNWLHPGKPPGQGISSPVRNPLPTCSAKLAPC